MSARLDHGKLKHYAKQRTSYHPGESNYLSAQSSLGTLRRIRSLSFSAENDCK